MQALADGRKILSVWPGESRYASRLRVFRGKRHSLSEGPVTVVRLARFGSKAAAATEGPWAGRFSGSLAAGTRGRIALAAKGHEALTLPGDTDDADGAALDGRGGTSSGSGR